MFSILLLILSLLGQTPSAKEQIDALKALPYTTAASAPKDRAGVVTNGGKLVQLGYNFYADRLTNTAYLMTNDGRVLHTWSRPGPEAWGHVELTPAGEVIVAATWDDAKRAQYPDAEAFDPFLFKLSRDSQVVWTRKIPAHHDVRLLRDGRLLTLTTYARHLPAREGAGGRVLAEEYIADNGIAWLDRNGVLLEELSIYDSLRRSSEVKLQTVADTDLLHCNAVQATTDGKVLITSRNQDLVALIAPKTNEVVWAWGQGKLSGPHSGRMLRNGHVLVFDNGLGRGRSRVVEVDPRTDRIVWQYAAEKPEDFYAESGGYCQRLRNGNTLITNSPNYTAFEVTAEGRVVWRFIAPGQSFVYRVHRYIPSFFEARFRRELAAKASRSRPAGTARPE